jgi:hypothetical protein
MSLDESLMPDPPRCARCSMPILDGELVVRDHGDWLHVRCARVVVLNDRFRESKMLRWESRKLVELGRERIEESRRLHMLEIVERLASVARGHAYCFACLAVQLRVTELRIRGAAQVLVVRGRFRRGRRVCGSCGGMEEALVPRGN